MLKKTIIKMKQKILFLGILTILFNYGFSQDTKVSLDETQANWLKSEFVNDEFLIKSYIPENLSIPKDSLPILFVLDADMSFAMTYDIVRWLRWGNEIPEVAIIGIAYGKAQAEWWQKRSRDYTTCQDKTDLWGKWELAGGGENFIKFLENELIPNIKNQYNLKSSNRTIIGLSFGGLISTDILFSKPNLFKKYIIAGPALLWNDKQVFKREKKYAQENKNLDVVVYTSVGSLDNETILNPWKEFNNLVLGRNYKNLNYKAEIIDGESHLSMFPAALTKGLKYVLNE
jgi:hypothetical protein